MTDILIRRVKGSDRAEWQSLWHDYNEFYERKVEPRTSERTWSDLLNGTGEPFGFVAEMDGKLVGFTHFFYVRSTSDWEPRCYMQDLFADPNARGRGIGRALIEAVYAHADKKQAAQIYWLTADSNKAARKLYDRVATVTPFVKYRR